MKRQKHQNQNQKQKEEKEQKIRRRVLRRKLKQRERWKLTSDKSQERAAKLEEQLSEREARL